MFLYKEVTDLPAFPEELIRPMYSSLIPSAPVGRWADSGFGYDYTDYTGEPLVKSLYHNRWANDLSRAWIFKHVAGLTDAHKVAFQEVSPGRQIVHSDYNKAFSLNYVLDAGGPRVVTRWFKQTGHALVRYKSTMGFQTEEGHRVNYDDGLEIIDSVVMQTGRWYLMNTAVLHDVANIESVRRRITVAWTGHDWIIRQFMGI